MEEIADPQESAIRQQGGTVPHRSRVLVLATDELVGRELIGEFRHHLREEGATEVMVIVPAVEKTALRHALGDVDAATIEARRRLDASLAELRRAGISASGDVGDSDPVVAAEDALRRFAADEVLIVAHAEDQARWFEGHLFERAKEELVPAVRMVKMRAEEGGAHHLVSVEDSAAGRQAPSDAAHELRLSPNLPRFTRGDLFGIVFAVVGTIVAIVLAATGPDANSPGGAAQILIAMGLALINMAHVVAITLLESVRYRGGWRRFFRNLSLVATPAAIVSIGLISLLH